MPRTFTQAELDAAPKIKIAGKEWPIPVLAPRQNRRILPRMSRMGSFNIANTTEADLDDMYEIVFWALTRAHPDLNQNDFMDWDIPLSELLPAMPIIAKQTGLLEVRPEGEDEGEATGKALTGTLSSVE